MNSSSIGWELWRSFLAVMHSGSLSGAARHLRLTQPTIGRHVDQLEQALAAPLFTRSQAGLRPTALAQSLVPHAEAMAVAAESLLRTASGDAGAASGTVRLTASEIIGVEVLPPILTRFRASSPGIAIELALTNRNDDLLRGDADIAVRMVRPRQAALVARRIGTVAIGLYAHRDYVALAGLPERPEQLPEHAVIGVDRNLAVLDGLRFGTLAPTADLFAFRCDSDLGQLAALRAGLGIGVCQVAIARCEPALVPVLQGQVRFELEMWLAMHEDLRYSRRVRMLFDHLAAELATHVVAGQDM